MVDIIIIAILVLMTIIGYKRGFFKSLTGIVSVIVSFAIAVCFFTQVADFLKTTAVYEAIYENIEKNVVASDENSEENENLSIPEKLFKSVEDSAEEIRDGVVMSFAEKIADVTVKMLSIVILFIVARVIVWIIIALFGIVKKLPLVGWFDSLLGAFLGFVRGFLIVYIVLFIIAMFSSFNPGNALTEKVNQSEFAKIMYNNNVFFDFINRD